MQNQYQKKYQCWDISIKKKLDNVNPCQSWIAASLCEKVSSGSSGLRSVGLCCHILSIGRSFFCSKQIIFFQKIGTCSDISDHFWLKSSGITKCSVQTVLNHTSHEILKGAARRNRRTRRTAIVAGLPSPCGSSWSPAPRDGFLKVLGLGDDKRNKCICYMLFYSNICAHIRSYHAIPYTCVYIYIIVFSCKCTSTYMCIYIFLLYYLYIYINLVCCLVLSCLVLPWFML
jgi:hypothetical protein